MSYGEGEKRRGGRALASEGHAGGEEKGEGRSAGLVGRIGADEFQFAERGAETVPETGSLDGPIAGPEGGFFGAGQAVVVGGDQVVVAGGGVLQLDPGFEQIVLAEVGGAFVAVPCEGKAVERDVVERNLGADSSWEVAVGEG